MHPTARAFFSRMIWCAPKSPWAPSAAPARMPAALPPRSRRHAGGAGARASVRHPTHTPPLHAAAQSQNKACRKERLESAGEVGRTMPTELTRMITSRASRCCATDTVSASGQRSGMARARTVRPRRQRGSLQSLCDEAGDTSACKRVSQLLLCVARRLWRLPHCGLCGHSLQPRLEERLTRIGLQR